MWMYAVVYKGFTEYWYHLRKIKLINNTIKLNLKHLFGNVTLQAHFLILHSHNCVSFFLHILYLIYLLLKLAS